MFHFVKKGKCENKFNIELNPMFNFDGIELMMGREALGGTRIKFKFQSHAHKLFLTNLHALMKKKRFNLLN